MFDEYPERFKIVYPSPDDVNGLCFRNNQVHYDMSVTHRPGRYAVRLPSRSPSARIDCLFSFSSKPIEADDCSRANETTRRKTVGCMREDLRSHSLLRGT